MNGPADVERVGVATSDAARRSLAWLAGFALGWELATAAQSRGVPLSLAAQWSRTAG